nr:cardiolipin synthase [Paenibacillus sp. HB172176]
MITYQHLYLLIMLLNIFLAATIIFLERRNATSTWAWIMILFFIPVLGFILYLILGQKIRKRQLNKMLGDNQRIIEERLEQQRQQLLSPELLPELSELANFRDLAYLNLSTSYALYTNDNAIDIFTDGNDKFDALFADIEAAEHHIHLVYYIVRNDELGKRLIKALTEKAKQGVEVRFLYDHIGSLNLPRRFFKEFREAGGKETAFFRSRIPFLNLKINYRNHRKLVIIDGKIGYIGGFNVGMEYLGLNKNFGYWRDTHLRVQGGAVLQMQAQFFMDWNLVSATKLELYAKYYPVHRERKGNIGMQLVGSGPDTEYLEIENAYIKMIYSAKEMICLQTPYFVPDESLLSALRVAALSGVHVRIMLPSKPDHFFVYWATHSYLGDLLAAGVQIYLYEQGFLHAKTLVVDGKAASVGTANLDIRSFRLNFEMNAFIFHEETALRLKRIFERDIASSRQLTRADYAGRPLFNRFKESISRLLSPIL